MDGPEFWHHHGGVSVPDLEAAIDWWGRVMGFTQVVERAHLPSVPCEMAMVANGNLHIELFEVKGAAAPPYDRSHPDHDLHTLGNKHIAFACEGIDTMAVALRERRADIVWVKRYPNGNANIFLRDPFGNLIEFVEYAKPEAKTSTL
jgi:methylmalonyl-CoA/ethylmalonyl-CoA epimerase